MTRTSSDTNAGNSQVKSVHQVPMSSPDINRDDINAVEAVLATHDLSIGPRIEEFERMMAKYLGVRHAVGVSSGTAGLHLCVIAAGVGEGDEVITTPFSFVASANCILYERARPIFVDIDPQTLNINPALVETAITPRTRAILPVDIFGQPTDYDAITEISQRFGLSVIEDACEAIGAEYRGRKAGTLGDMAVFGFYPNKQMTTAEGGIIVTDRGEWDMLFRSLRNQGRDESGTWLNHVRLGYNYRLNEMSAALGVTQLARIDELLEKRERVAQMYDERLSDVGGVSIPYRAPTTTRMSWFVYVIRMVPEINRDTVMSRLQKHGIGCRPYFTPIHLQPLYVERFGYEPGDFPVTEAVAQSTLALPFHSNLSEKTIDLVCKRLRQAVL
jgi:perosamine synthetase